MLVRLLFQPPWGQRCRASNECERWRFLTRLPLPPPEKSSFSFSNPFFSALRPPKFPQTKGINMSQTKLSLMGSSVRGYKKKVPIMLHRLSPVSQRKYPCWKCILLGKPSVTRHIDGCFYWLTLKIWESWDGLRTCLCRKSPAAWWIWRENQANRQVPSMYPPRAGQRKSRVGDLWCHKRVPAESCLWAGCLWSWNHKSLLQLPLPPRLRCCQKTEQQWTRASRDIICSRDRKHEYVVAMPRYLYAFNNVQNNSSSLIVILQNWGDRQ